MQSTVVGILSGIFKAALPSVENLLVAALTNLISELLKDVLSKAKSAQFSGEFAFLNNALQGIEADIEAKLTPDLIRAELQKLIPAA